MNRRFVTAYLLLWLLATGCSVQKYAINKVGDALASGGSVYESDEDLELVGDAFPFSLKLLESLLAESPLHRGLLLSACKGFASYAYVYVHNRADVAAEIRLADARALRARARRLYLRAHRYGIRGLELSRPGIGDEMLVNPVAAASGLSKKDVPLIYWTAAALGLAISASRNDAAMLARLPEVDALLQRALELDESWGQGALHELEVVYSMARPGEPDFDEMTRHYQRALELSDGRRAGLYVAFAESAAVPRQDRSQFDELLERALAIDPDEHEEMRLANLVAQRRARWLMTRADELILPTEPSALDNAEAIKPQ